MKDISALVQALASLLWPLVAFWALFTFREQIKDVLARIRKGKVLGQEIELQDTLTALDTVATTAASEVAELPKASEDASAEKPENTDSEVTRILEDASRSPKIALMALAAEIERELRQTLATKGHPSPHESLPAAMGRLVQIGSFPPSLMASVELFWKVRSRLVHGYDASPDDMARALDSGITILKAIKAVPREINTVHRAEVPLYADPAGTQLVKGVTGLILETKQPDGRATYRIFPTTKQGHTVGRQVSWEWNQHGRKYGEMWYRDLDTGEMKPAWLGSMEFIGRHLDEV